MVVFIHCVVSVCGVTNVMYLFKNFAGLVLVT